MYVYRIIMANAELLIAFGDTEEALKVLSKVTEDKSLVKYRTSHRVMVCMCVVYVGSTFKRRREWLTCI